MTQGEAWPCFLQDPLCQGHRAHDSADEEHSAGALPDEGRKGTAGPGGASAIARETCEGLEAPLQEMGRATSYSSVLLPLLPFS